MTTEYHQVPYKLRQALEENAKLKATVGELREALIKTYNLANVPANIEHNADFLLTYELLENSKADYGYNSIMQAKTQAPTPTGSWLSLKRL